MVWMSTFQSKPKRSTIPTDDSKLVGWRRHMTIGYQSPKMTGRQMVAWKHCPNHSGFGIQGGQFSVVAVTIQSQPDMLASTRKFLG